MLPSWDRKADASDPRCCAVRLASRLVLQMRKLVCVGPFPNFLETLAFCVYLLFYLCFFDAFEYKEIFSCPKKIDGTHRVVNGGWP